MGNKKLTEIALDFWTKKHGITQEALAEKTGLSQNYISQIQTGRRYGSIETHLAIANAFDVSLPEFFACKDDGPDIVFVNRVRARPRAGTGGLETDGEFEGQYAFHRTFIERKGGGGAGSMAIFRIAGDSMKPTLEDGDLIMVNQNDTDIRTGYIYLLRMEKELMVKRLENRPGGILLIRSDNKEYKEIEIDMGAENVDVQVFGRMVWSCREY
jgi:phage repressor protein C with HTH and peptisase S24 domain